MDYELEVKFQSLKAELEANFGEGLDVPSILFLIGVNELGQGHKEFSKREKTELMHIAICTVLEPHGYYQYEGNDKDDWPHFTLVKELPKLNDREQQHLMKEAILDYFIQNGYHSPSKPSV